MKKVKAKCSEEPVDFFRSRTFNHTVIIDILLMSPVWFALREVTKTLLERIIRFIYAAEALAEGG